MAARDVRFPTRFGEAVATWTPAGDGSLPVLVCIPGGALTRAYYDIPVPGDRSYSFAEHARAAGWSTLCVDPIGCGDSAKPDDLEVDFEVQAAALSDVVEALPAELGTTGRTVAVAHSMGGYVAMRQQARFRSYAGLAILGTTNGPVAGHEITEEMLARAVTAEGRQAMIEQLAASMPEPYLRPTKSDLAPRRPWYHLDDVPEAPRAATLVSTVPRRCAAESSTPGVGAADAAAVDVPVLLAYGELDISLAPHREPSAFTASDDVSLYLLRGSAHCHNHAATRAALWDRLLAWATLLA